MKEYLRWLDNRMLQKSKKALMLMDNFSAHELVIEKIEELGKLKARRRVKRGY
jgi:hypothetical protein